MGFIGKIIQVLIGDSLREIVTEIYDDYNQESTHVCPAGIDSSPLPDDQGVSIIIDNANHSVNVGVYPDAQSNPGELRIYGRDTSGNIVSLAYFDNDGKITIEADDNLEISATEIHLNGAGKTFVTHKELDTALQLFIVSLNSLFGTKLDGGGTAGALTIDISAATTTTVKTDG